MHWLRRLVLTAPCFVLGCDDAGDTGEDTEGGSTSAADSSSGGPSPTTTTTSGSTTDADASTSGDASSSGEGTTGSLPSCDAFAPGEAFEIAADVSDARIHPHAAGDDTGAWFSFVAPEPSGSLFDVMLMHLRCADDVDVPAQVVNTAPGNDIDASVAVSGERVLVVWNTDDGTGGTSNLQINARAFDLAGMPLEDTQHRITTSVEGTPITENHTFALVGAHADGFAVAGLRAHPDSPAFVAFAQTLGPDGALLGDAFGPPIEADISHMFASTAGDWLGYQRSGDDDQVWLVHPDSPAAAAFAGMPASGGQLVERPEDPDAPLVAAAVGMGNSFDVGIALGTGAPLLLGGAATLEHNPTVARNADGDLAVVFHRNVAGLNNAVVFQRLRIEDDAVVALGDEVELDTESPPYPPSLTWTPGGWLVTWTRGQSPEFSTWGRVLAPR